MSSYRSKTDAPPLNALEFGRSISFDIRLLDFELQCAHAHASELARAGKIDETESMLLHQGLRDTRRSIMEADAKTLMSYEDVSGCLETQLAEAVGSLAGKLKLGRSRNDVAVTALRLWLRHAGDAIKESVKRIVERLLQAAEAHAESVITGYSHLQPARPITLGFLCAAHANGFARVIRFFDDTQRLLDACPLGSGAMSGGEAWINRNALAEELGFSCPTLNALDSIGSRDFVQGFLFACVQLGNHLSRFAADADLLVAVGAIHVVGVGESREARYGECDAAILRRAQQVPLAALNAVLTTTTSLPLSYFRDLQEDKEGIFSAYDALCAALIVAEKLIDSIRHSSAIPLHPKKHSDILATDYAEALVEQLTVSYKEAHAIVAELYRRARVAGKTVDELDETSVRDVDTRLRSDMLRGLSFTDAVASRSAVGGTAPSRLRSDITRLRTLMLAADVGASVKEKVSSDNMEKESTC